MISVVAAAMMGLECLVNVVIKWTFFHLFSAISVEVSWYMF